jgi:hypothetical protein
VPKYQLQIRVHGSDWQTKSVAETRARAAMATTSVVRALAADGHRHIAIRIVPDTEGGGARSPT